MTRSGDVTVTDSLREAVEEMLQESGVPSAFKGVRMGDVSPFVRPILERYILNPSDLQSFFMEGKWMAFCGKGSSSDLVCSAVIFTRAALLCRMHVYYAVPGEVDIKSFREAEVSTLGCFNLSDFTDDVLRAMRSRYYSGRSCIVSALNVDLKTFSNSLEETGIRATRKNPIHCLEFLDGGKVNDRAWKGCTMEGSEDER